MASIYKRYYQCFKEINNIDKSGCQIVYSQITKRQFEQYCNMNLSSCRDNVISDYKESVFFQTIFQIVCFITLFFAGTRLLECVNYVCGWMGNDWVMLGLLAAICFCASRIIAVNIKSKLFPSNQEIERQLKYQKYVEENYCPLLELQEVMQKNTLSSINIKALESLIEVSFYDKAGKISSQSAYFIGGTLEYEKDGVLDFSGIDGAIIRKTKEFGLYEFKGEAHSV